jgi:SAM-dependent methyltransferase
MKISELQASDPALYSTDKFSDHSYNEFYDSLFDGKENARLNILEIGINEGGSVRLWADYLKKSKITGIDISDKWKMPEGTPDSYNVNIFYLDAYNENGLDDYVGFNFDVIIDDGPHTLASQIFALENFPSYLKAGGILIIEDVPAGCEEEILKHLPTGGVAEVIDLRSVKGRWDDCLIIFIKD